MHPFGMWVLDAAFSHPFASSSDGHSNWQHYISYRVAVDPPKETDDDEKICIDRSKASHMTETVDNDLIYWHLEAAI